MTPPDLPDPSVVNTAAPARIDLAGGTLDIWPLYLLVPGAVTVNLAISRLARVRLSHRADGRLLLRSLDTKETVEAEGHDAPWNSAGLPLLRALVDQQRPPSGLFLSTRSGVPPGSGLGGSSALAVAVLRALDLQARRPRSRRELLPIARDVEAQVIGVPTGIQDHTAAAYGGLSALHLRAGEPERERIPAAASALAARLVLVRVGASRLSARTNWAMLRGAVDGDAEILERFADIARAARDMRDALLGGSFEKAAAAMTHEYAARRGLVEGLETSDMKAVHDAALDAGALAGKVCGAGGGGGMVFLVPPRGKTRVSRAAARAGAVPLAFRPDLVGLRP